MGLLLIGHPVFQMGKKTSQEAPLCGKTSENHSHLGLLIVNSATSSFCPQGTWRGDPGTSSPLHACFWVHEVVKVLRVMHMWHVILPCIPSCTLFTLQLLDGCSMQTSITVGKLKRELRQENSAILQVQLIHQVSLWMPRFKRLHKITVQWMTVCKRKGSLSRMLPLIYLGFSLGFWGWFFFSFFKANIYICLRFLVRSW